jgi:ABC-type transport system substrate-binding protein
LTITIPARGDSDYQKMLTEAAAAIEAKLNKVGITVHFTPPEMASVMRM